MEGPVDIGTIAADVGRKIKEIRRNQRPAMSVQRLADMLGKNRNTVDGYERGTIAVPLPVLAQIAAIFGVKAGDLLPSAMDDIIDDLHLLPNDKRRIFVSTTRAHARQIREILAGRDPEERDDHGERKAAAAGEQRDKRGVN